MTWRDRRDRERGGGGGADDLVGALAHDRRRLTDELARDAPQIDEPAERVGLVEDVAQLARLRRSAARACRSTGAAVPPPSGVEGADQVQERHLVGRFADEAARR